MKLRKYTLEELTEAVKESYSMAQVLKRLNVKVAGGNYDTLKKAIKHFDLDVSHFRGRGWNKDDHSKILKKNRKIRPLNEILSKNIHYQSYKLKKRLIAAGIKKHQCEECGIIEWNGKPAPIELDHINGVRTDNRLENLRILCPNCHAQTKTYRGRNIKKA
jgi:hypothetical protein